MKSQGSVVAEDRRILLAEQNASMERLVNSISATVNRDLPLRMEEIVRAEVHAKKLALLHHSLKSLTLGTAIFHCQLFWHSKHSYECIS